MNAGPALTQAVEWTGAVLGIAGSLLMSFNRASSKYAWYPWIASNVLLIAFGVLAGAWGIFTMQAVFLAINLNGLWRWHLRDARRARREARAGTGDGESAHGRRPSA